MRVELHTNGFEKSPSVENFLNDSANDLAQEFLRNEGDVHIKVIVHEDRQRSQSRKPHFICEIQLKSGGSKKYYKTHKSSEDFRIAVNQAFHAMKMILQKRSDRRHDLKVGQAISERPVMETAEAEAEMEEFQVDSH